MENGENHFQSSKPHSSKTSWSSQKINKMSREEKSSTAINANDTVSNVFRKDRQCTDVAALVIMAIYMFGLLILVFLCLPNSDVFRVIYGYDDCGNVCGRKNTRIADLACSGQNMLPYKYLLLTINPASSEATKSCVEKCPTSEGYKLFFNRCIRLQISRAKADRLPQSLLDEVWQDVHSCGLELFLLCLLCLLVSLVVLSVLWCIPGLMLPCMLLVIVVACLVTSFVHWLNWKLKSDADNRKGYLISAVIFTVLSIIIFCFAGYIWKKIQFVTELLQEGGNAIRQTLLLLLYPTTISLLITYALGLYFFLIIESTARPTVIGGSVEFVKNPLVHTARWYNLVALIWFNSFLVDCQHMVTAGAISAWYFTQDKSRLGNITGRSFLTLLTYHLGSVALGSLILTITALALAVVKMFQKLVIQTKNGYLVCIAFICMCFLNCIRSVLELIQRNAYIIVAMQGLSLFKADKSAMKLMATDAINFVVVNSVTKIVFLMAELFVLLLVGSISVVILQRQKDLYHPYILAGMLIVTVSVITHCFMAVCEMTVATVFLCFLKDIELNNGTDRPYYMSRNLRKFLPNEVQPETVRQTAIP
ncbi:choline transporter-like protein 1 isoform X2 [Wyeomyia smithii]|uniref:choline transporter-like protein 1 isoform X2 n=1 Tax=Wyeomyia smithii TaxID=174621 RepID=UPI00246803D9|nr:choline transporter-like protein 1 isoform X2 [Wyeomyia smithii]